MDFPKAIVDAHHHLWHLGRVNYPWLLSKGTPRFFGDPTPIQQNYLPTDFSVDIDTIPVVKSVHIQVGAAENHHLTETQWVQQQVETAPLPNAIVAFCDLSNDNYQQQIEQHLEYSAIRGFRQIVGREPNEDKQTGTNKLIENPTWLQGLNTLSQYDLSFDLQLIPEQMDAMYTILKQVENLKVAICHCGSPWSLNEQYVSTDYWERWRKGLQQLAELPNVHCKISGLSMFQQCWNHTVLNPIIEIVIATFGVERCMFGSNFPVDKLHVDYSTIWNSYNQVTQSYSVNERESLFASNAELFYRI